MLENQSVSNDKTIKEFAPEIMSILLKDQTTKKNLIWATDNYARRGKGYFSSDHLTVENIKGPRGNIVKPRSEKSKDERTKRVRDMAEVFTPSWICNKQNNLVDEAWFGYKYVFNVETEQSWLVNAERISFPTLDGKTWQDYVLAVQMEISCGEAPYLTSRYDTVSGETIAIGNRIGLLDRKLRVISENVENDEMWLNWAIKAFQCVYGFDWQGDNVFLARQNLLMTFVDFYQSRFMQIPSTELLMEIATILSWNIWQMDGLKCVVPNSCHKEANIQTSFLDDFEEKSDECIGCQKNDIHRHNGIYCKIKDWQTNKTVQYVSLLKGYSGR